MSKKTNLVFLLVFIVVIAVAAASVQIVYSLKQYEKKGELKQVKLGLIIPLSGDAAFLGESIKRGVELALMDSGMKNINLIIEDTGCEAEKVISSMNYLIETERVVGIIGEACSGATLAAAPIAEHNNVVLISPASTNPEISNAGDFIFRTAPSDTFQSRCAAELLLSRNFKKIMVLYANEPYGLGYADPLLETLNATRADSDIAVGMMFERGTTDFKSHLTRIGQEEADAVFIISNSQNSFAAVISQIRSGFPDIAIFGAESITEQNLINELGDDADGITAITFSLGTRQFEEHYKDAYGESPTIFGAQSYDAFNVLASGIRSGATDGPSLKSALSNIDFEGVSGKIRFDAHGDVAAGCFMSTVSGNEVSKPVSF